MNKNLNKILKMFNFNNFTNNYNKQNKIFEIYVEQYQNIYFGLMT